MVKHVCQEVVAGQAGLRGHARSAVESRYYADEIDLSCVGPGNHRRQTLKVQGCGKMEGTSSGCCAGGTWVIRF
jgi:hypothetical protein